MFRWFRGKSDLEKQADLHYRLECLLSLASELGMKFDWDSASVAFSDVAAVCDFGYKDQRDLIRRTSKLISENGWRNTHTLAESIAFAALLIPR